MKDKCIKTKLNIIVAIIFAIIVLCSCQEKISILNDNENLDSLVPSTTQSVYIHKDMPYEVVSYDKHHNINDKVILFEHEIEEVRISVVGDIMFHNTQLMKAYDYNTRTFNFDAIFEQVEPFLKTSDIAFGNLETTLHGPFGSENSVSEYNYYGYSGYPRFNTPDSIVDELLDTGFDFISTANNHCLDRNLEGMLRTIDKLDNAGIAHTGTFKSEELRKPYELIESKGITFAVVNYTYSTNGLYLSDENMALVNNMELYQEELVEKLYADIEAAEASEADYVIAMMHYGYEYHAFEDERYQKPLTYELIKRGADIVFGGHPHVMQPVEIINQIEDTVYDEPKIIIYSLGNFISSQRNISKYNGNTDIGVIFDVYFDTINGANPRITGIGFVPTYTLWQAEDIITIPISLDTEKDEFTLSQWDLTRLEFAKEYTISHLTTYTAMNNTLGEEYLYEGIHRFDLLDE